MNFNEAKARIAELEAQLSASAVTGVVGTLNTKERKDTRFLVFDTAAGQVYIPSAGAVLTGDTVTITGITFGAKPKVERKKMADMTPAERLEHARSVAAAAIKRAAELEAQLAPKPVEQPTEELIEA